MCHCYIFFGAVNLLKSSASFYIGLFAWMLNYKSSLHTLITELFSNVFWKVWSCGFAFSFFHCDFRTKVSNFDEVYVLHRKSLPKSSVMNVCFPLFSSRTVITVVKSLWFVFVYGPRSGSGFIFSPHRFQPYLVKFTYLLFAPLYCLDIFAKISYPCMSGFIYGLRSIPLIHT